METYYSFLPYVVYYDRLYSCYIYFGIYFLSVFLIFLGDITNNKYLIGLGVLIPIIFAGSRFCVGTDFVNYLIMYDNYKNVSFEKFFAAPKFSKIFIVLLSYITKSIGEISVFFYAYVILMFVPFVIFVRTEYKKISTALIVCMFLFTYFNFGLNIIRQAAAVGICSLGFIYIRRRELSRFLIVVAAAMLIHTSAIISVPLYYLYQKSNKIITFKLFIYIVLGIVGIVFVDEILHRVGNISLFSEYSDKYASDGSLGKASGMNMSWVLHILVLGIFIAFRRYLIKYNDFNRYLITIIIVAVCIETVGFISPFMKRAADYYYAVPSILLFSQLPYISNKSSRIYIVIGIIAYVTVLFIFMFYIQRIAGIFPYGTLFKLL